MNSNDPRSAESLPWGRAILEMKLTGISAMLACHMEPKYFTSHPPILELEISEAMVPLQQSPAMATLETALKRKFGDLLNIQISPGPAMNSPAALSGTKRINEYITAANVMMNDDMVRQMLEQYPTAKLIVDTIKPQEPPFSRPSRPM